MTEAWIDLGRRGRAKNWSRAVCRICNEKKPLEEFRKKPASGAYSRACMDCELPGNRTVRLTESQKATNDLLRLKLKDCVEWEVEHRTPRYFLYHLLDGERALLYIGITNSPYIRLDNHLKTKVGVAKMVVVESFETRKECVAAERRAIRKLRPPLNKRVYSTN